MTKKQKIEAIYRAKPELANDDVGLILYILERCGAEITPQLEHAFRKMGNPEHWTRQCRVIRAEHPELVNDKVKESRHKEFIDYRYNAKPYWQEVFNH